MSRFGLRFLGGAIGSNANKARSFSATAHHDFEAHEAKKWEKITYAGIAVCTVLAIYNLSKGHPHYPDPPFPPYVGKEEEADQLISRAGRKTFTTKETNSSGSCGYRDKPYPYLHIRNKDFPWGPDGLFEKKKKRSEH